MATTTTNYGLKKPAYTDSADIKEAVSDNMDTIDTVLAGKVNLIGNETIQGVKTFASSPVVPTPTTNMQSATKLYVDSADGALTTAVGTKVTKTGDETIAGIKIFSSSPIVPTPTTPTQVANKSYADTQDAFRLALTGGTMTGSITETKPSISNLGATNVQVYRDLAQASFYDSGGRVVVIELPSFYGGFDTIRILGYDYFQGVDDENCWELLVGGNLDGTNNWYGVSAVLTGQAPFSTVRVGKNASNKPVILLGSATNTWNYSHIAIVEVVGRGATTTGWSITFTTSEAGITVQKTPVVQRYTALQADVLDSNFTNATGTFNTLSNINQPVIAGKKYKVTGYLKYTNTAPIGTGSLFLSSGSGTIIGRDYKAQSLTAIGTAGLAGSQFSLIGAGLEVNVFDAIFTCVTTGVLALSANISGGAGTITIYAGSYLTAQEINMI